MVDEITNKELSNASDFNQDSSAIIVKIRETLDEINEIVEIKEIRLHLKKEKLTVKSDECI